MADCMDYGAAYAMVAAPSTPARRLARSSEPPRIVRERAVFPLRVGPKLPSFDDDSDDEDMDMPKRCPGDDTGVACVRRADPVYYQRAA